jgi:hypothetical protein
MLIHQEDHQHLQFDCSVDVLCCQNMRSEKCPRGSSFFPTTSSPHNVMNHPPQFERRARRANRVESGDPRAKESRGGDRLGHAIDAVGAICNGGVNPRDALEWAGLVVADNGHAGSGGQTGGAVAGGWTQRRRRTTWFVEHGRVGEARA